MKETPATLLEAQKPSQRSNGAKTWESYLEERNLVAWAEANPEVADQLRQKLVAKGQINS